MKITYIANSRIPTERAHGYQLTKMCEQFAKAGADVLLLAPFKRNAIISDLFEYYHLEKNFKFSLIKMPDFLLYEKILGRLAMYLQWLIFTVKLFFLPVESGSVIYTRDAGAAWVLGLRGFKINLEIHHWWEKRKILTRFLTKKASHIITTNHFIKEEFNKIGFSKEKILVMPNGIDLNIFDISLNQEQAIKESGLDPGLFNKKLLLYTGSFKTAGEEKGILEIIKAIQILKDKDIFFIAAGGSEADIKYYNEKVLGYGVADQVKLMGRKSQTELAVLQKAADILLMPFPAIDRYIYFMSPLKTFEYMASQRVIIASDLPSIREILNEKNCLFCRPGDSAGLAEKIKQAINDPILRENLAEQAFVDVKQYSWEKRAQKILDFIK